jgi:hypothetical protein
VFLAPFLSPKDWRGVTGFGAGLETPACGRAAAGGQSREMPLLAYSLRRAAGSLLVLLIVIWLLLFAVAHIGPVPYHPVERGPLFELPWNALQPALAHTWNIGALESASLSSSSSALPKCGASEKEPRSGAVTLAEGRRTAQPSSSSEAGSSCRALSASRTCPQKGAAASAICFETSSLGLVTF